LNLMRNTPTRFLFKYGRRNDMNVVSYFYYFENAFFTGYLIVIIGLLVCSFFLQTEFKKESFNWIYILSTVIAWLYFINLLIYAGEAFMAWYGQNNYEWYAFSNHGAYNNRFLLVTIITFCAALLFFIRKLRVNRWYIIFFLVIQNFQSFFYTLTNLYQDYLPSSWSTYYTETVRVKIISWLVFLLIITAVYWICNKRKKLPYPSLFLK